MTYQNNTHKQNATLFLRKPSSVNQQLNIMKKQLLELERQLDHQQQQHRQQAIQLEQLLKQLG